MFTIAITCNTFFFYIMACHLRWVWHVQTLTPRKAWRLSVPGLIIRINL